MPELGTMFRNIVSSDFIHSSMELYMLLMDSGMRLLLTAWLKRKASNPGTLKSFGKGNAEETLTALGDGVREPRMIGFAVLWEVQS